MDDSAHKRVKVARTELARVNRALRMLFRAAEEALYAAKNGGRNRTHMDVGEEW